MRRVAVLGKNTIAVEATEALLSSKQCTVVFVSPSVSDLKVDGWQRSFTQFAASRNLPVVPFKKIRDAESVAYLKRENLDFLFSFQYDQILTKDVMHTARFGAINLHFSPLPKYRGMYPVVWALMNGEDEFGVTLHHIDEGVDTGDIIAKRLFVIGEMGSARELYERCAREGKELFAATIDAILNLRNERIPQDNSKALYYPKGSIDFTQNLISWNKDTRSLANWIRAFIFPPFQQPEFILEGTRYRVIGVTPDYSKNRFEKPGTLVKREGNLFTFATHDAYLRVSAITP